MIFLLFVLQFGLGKRVSYSCSPGLYWTGQTCLPCEAGCKCSSYLGCDDDITCDIGYALQTEKEKTCVACPTGCSICLVVGVNGFVCNQCSDGYQLIGNICIPLAFDLRLGNVKFFGFGLWGIPQWSVPTENLPKGIAEAYSTLPCTLRDSSSSLCTKCPDGSWLNEFLQCEKCSPNCKLCTSRGTCVTCQSGYFWNAVANENKYNSYFNGAGECQPCNVANATICSNTGIVALMCVDGTYISDGKCTDCITGCKSCGDGTSCIQCFDGYYLNSNTCSYCSGNSNTLTSCQSCSDATSCTKCNTGYMLINTQCVVIPSDLGCESFKISLTNTVVCGVCLNGYYLNQGACYPCNEYNSVYELCYNMDENTQPSVYPTQCITNENDPSSLTNYFLFQQVSQEVNTNVCVQNVNACIQINNTSGVCSQCASGYTLGQGQCYKCSTLLNCIACSYTTELVCTQCVAATYNLNNQCLPCYDGCSQCQSANDCQKCSDGYYFDGQQCSQCSVNNCKQCNATGACTQCLSQFFLYQNTCQLCPPGCAVCGESVGRQCTRCLDGFYLKNGGCSPGSQYCASYYYDGSCKHCIYGSYASANNECLPCITLGAGVIVLLIIVCLWGKCGYKLLYVTHQFLGSYFNYVPMISVQHIYICNIVYQTTTISPNN